MDQGTLIFLGTISLAAAFIIMGVWPIMDSWFDDLDDNRIDKW
jgi:sensor domain CHASE-containing protein